jgi:hypothetical protein
MDDVPAVSIQDESGSAGQVFWGGLTTHHGRATVAAQLKEHRWPDRSLAQTIYRI